MPAQFYNPYLFDIPPGVTLFVSTQFNHNIEIGLTMTDITLIDLNLTGRQQDFLPCIPASKQGPGFIWGADSCSPSCPPLQFHYGNPDTFTHRIALHAGFKNFGCGDGNRFLNNDWSDCTARLVTNSPISSVTLGYKTVYNDPVESTILIVLGDPSVGMPIQSPLSAFQAHGLAFQSMNEEKRTLLRQQLLSLLKPE